MPVKKKINKIHVAGMDIKIIWCEKKLREQGASALYVPQDQAIYLHQIYKGNNLETMKCMTHELIHVLERYMNFSLEENVLDSVAQGIVVAFAESGLLDLDQFNFEE
jgi:hypothetical protein